MAGAGRNRPNRGTKRLGGRIPRRLCHHHQGSCAQFATQPNAGEARLLTMDATTSCSAGWMATMLEKERCGHYASTVVTVTMPLGRSGDGVWTVG